MMLHHEQTISGEEMHTLITFIYLALWLLIQLMAYKLIYNPLIDYIRSHVRSVRFYYIVRLPVLTVGWYSMACKPNLYVQL